MNVHFVLIAFGIVLVHHMSGAIFPVFFDCCTEVANHIPRRWLRRVVKFEIQKSDDLCRIPAVILHTRRKKLCGRTTLTLQSAVISYWVPGSDVTHFITGLGLREAPIGHPFSGHAASLSHTTPALFFSFRFAHWRESPTVSKGACVRAPAGGTSWGGAALGTKGGATARATKQRLKTPDFCERACRTEAGRARQNEAGAWLRGGGRKGGARPHWLLRGQCWSWEEKA
ncbi:C-C motif chemokine 28 [Crotalus adamanteus]|uniref:C-C motif chemokine 28 n=1 Tax=Crotalus adamanteus TaxID=8729 RepID=A0AAW1C4C0_CROAD